jgi:phosphatidate phosphatase LPIN
MKIGQAGEAFFVFETEDDVPADLITSPILRPTKPDEAKDKDVYRDVAAAAAGDAQEPEFLDLDAVPSGLREEKTRSTYSSSITTKSEQDNPTKFLPSPSPSPPPLSATPASLLSRTRPKVDTPEGEVDALLKVAQKEVHIPDVQFKDSEC